MDCPFVLLIILRGLGFHSISKQMVDMIKTPVCLGIIPFADTTLKQRERFFYSRKINLFFLYAEIVFTAPF